MNNNNLFKKYSKQLTKFTFILKIKFILTKNKYFNVEVGKIIYERTRY